MDNQRHVRVTNADGTPECFLTAAKWHIDEAEMLHVLKADGSGVGSYAPRAWGSVAIADAGTSCTHH